MSIGNLKTYGNKGNNIPWQLKMLHGQQCACDSLQELVGNTDQVEPLLVQILSAIQAGSDYEAMLVVDNAGVTWLEVRVWNPSTGTFDPPVYYLAGTNTSGTPTAPITYINPNTYLATIASNTTGLALETTLSTMNAKFVNGNDVGDVTVNNGVLGNAVNIQDGGNSVTVDDGGVALATYPFPANPVSGYDASIVSNTPVDIIAAVPGQTIYITQILVTNAHATVGTLVSIQDDFSPSFNKVYIGYAASAGGGFSISFPTPLKMPASGQKVQAACLTSGADVQVSINGFSL